MKKGTKQIAIGAAVAAGVGYIAGVLTAPKSGKETRKDIKSTAIKAKKESERRLKQIHSELSNLIKQAKPKLKTASAKTKTGLTKAIEQATAAKRKVGEVLSGIHEGDAVEQDLTKALDEAKKAAKHLEQFLKKDAKKADK